MAIVNGYAEVEDLKEHLGDSRGDNDALMERAIEAASRVVDTYTHRRFYLDAVSSGRLYLAKGDRIFTDDFTELTAVTPEYQPDVLGNPYATTSYRAGPLNAPFDDQPYWHIDGVFGWGVVQVDALWGWASVPVAVVQATLLKAARIYKRRESVTGTLGFDEFALRLSSTDPDVADLLSPYRFVSVG
jgi:hypothetical protein